MVPLANLVIVVLILALVIVELWFLYEGRPRGPKAPGANHHHVGVELSRHEQGGRIVVTFQCQRCPMRFNGML